MPGGRIVDHQLHAGGQRLPGRDPGDVVRERRERQQHRGVIVAPVAHEVAAVGEQRVVGVHDRLGHAGGARGEGEIGDLVRIVVDRREAARRGARALAGRARARAPSAAGRPCAARQPSAKAASGSCRCASAPQPSSTSIARASMCRSRLVISSTGVVAVQRRVADVAVARAGDERDQRLEPVGEPQADALARAQSGLGEGIGDRIDPARAAARQLRRRAPSRAANASGRAAAWPASSV